MFSDFENPQMIEKVTQAVAIEDMQALYQLMKQANYTDFSMDEPQTLLDFALYYAAAANCPDETAFKLLSLGARIEFWEYGAMFEAINHNKIALVKAFIHQGYPINYFDETNPLGAAGCAAAEGYLELLKYLVSVGGDTGLWNDGAFRYALAGGHKACAQFLLNVKEQDFFSEFSYAVREIVDKRNLDMFIWVVEESAQRKIAWPQGIIILNHIAYNHVRNFFDYLISKEWKPDGEFFLKAIQGNQEAFVLDLLQYTKQWLNTIDKDLLLKTLKDSRTSFECAIEVFIAHEMIDSYQTSDEYFDKCLQFARLQKKLDSKPQYLRKKI